MGMRVFVDANVLFSRTLRDWLFLLRNASEGGMYTVGSTEDVLAETLSRLRDARPKMPGGDVARLRDHLVENLDEVIDDYAIEPWMTERDPGDAHVRAACTTGRFDMLLTSDVGLLDDAERNLAVAYEPIGPDDFFVLIDDSAPWIVRAVTERQTKYFLEKCGEADLPAHLRAAGCRHFADRVNGHVHAVMSA